MNSSCHLHRKSRPVLAHLSPYVNRGWFNSRHLQNVKNMNWLTNHTRSGAQRASQRVEGLMLTRQMFIKLLTKQSLLFLSTYPIQERNLIPQASRDWLMLKRHGRRSWSFSMGMIPTLVLYFHCLCKRKVIRSTWRVKLADLWWVWELVSCSFIVTMNLQCCKSLHWHNVHWWIVVWRLQPTPANPRTMDRTLWWSKQFTESGRWQWRSSINWNLTLGMFCPFCIPCADGHSGTQLGFWTVSSPEVARHHTSSFTVWNSLVNAARIWWDGDGICCQRFQTERHGQVDAYDICGNFREQAVHCSSWQNYAVDKVHQEDFPWCITTLVSISAGFGLQLDVWRCCGHKTQAQHD